MFELGWEITELENLNETGRKLLVDLRSLLMKYNAPTPNDFVDEDVPNCLKSFCSDLTQFIKNVVVHQREPATHVFVFMISPEERNKKPYALPIQCIPCAGIKEVNIRQFLTKIVEQMRSRNMKIAGKLHALILQLITKKLATMYIFTEGFSSDGAFNYLRVRGNSRPLSIIQIRQDVRAKYNRLSQKTMLKMLTPISKKVLLFIYINNYTI